MLIHGGFDSLIEEFYPIWQRIAMAGSTWSRSRAQVRVVPVLWAGLRSTTTGNGRLVPFWTTSDLRLPGWSASRWAGTGQCALRAGTAHRSRGRVATRFRLALPVTGGYARPGPDDAAAQTADALECAGSRTPDTDSAADRGPYPLPG